MDDSVIVPRREKGDPQLPETGILVLNPSDMPVMADLAQSLALKRHFLFNARLYSDEQMFLAGPAVGAPMAVLCLEKLIVLGARRVIVYGWCGSIHPGLRLSELFLPVSGVSEEGTSQHYVSNKPWNSLLHAELMQALRGAGREAKSGDIWTTDALYRETRKKVEQYGAQGLMAVDMEYTALQAVAAFREVLLAAVMLVSDELFMHRWQPVYSHKQFRTLSRQTLSLLFSLFHKATFP